MAYATDIHGANAVIAEHFVATIRSAVARLVEFRSARKAMTTPGDLTLREMDYLELNGHNIERLALKIGFGV